MTIRDWHNNKIKSLVLFLNVLIGTKTKNINFPQFYCALSKHQIQGKQIISRLLEFSTKYYYCRFQRCVEKCHIYL